MASSRPSQQWSSRGGSGVGVGNPPFGVTSFWPAWLPGLYTREADYIQETIHEEEDEQGDDDNADQPLAGDRDADADANSEKEAEHGVDDSERMGSVPALRAASGVSAADLRPIDYNARDTGDLHNLPKNLDEAYTELREWLWGDDPTDETACEDFRNTWKENFEEALGNVVERPPLGMRLCGQMVFNFMLIPSLCGIGFVFHVAAAIFLYPLPSEM